MSTGIKRVTPIYVDYYTNTSCVFATDCVYIRFCTHDCGLLMQETVIRQLLQLAAGINPVTRRLASG